MSNATHLHDLFIQSTTIGCYNLRTVGYILSVILAISFVSNLTVLWLFFKHKDLQTSFHKIVIILITANLFSSVIELPLMIWNCFKCGYILNSFLSLLESSFIKFKTWPIPIKFMVFFKYFERFYIGIVGCYAQSFALYFTGSLTIYLLV